MGTALLRLAVKGSETQGGGWWRIHRWEEKQPVGILVGMSLGWLSAWHGSWRVATYPDS